MRFRFGVVIGFAAGYWFGTKAGRARHEQLRRWVEQARSSSVADVAVDKAKAVLDLGLERARDLMPSGNGSAEGAGYSPSR
jgi:hypothetical protein